MKVSWSAETAHGEKKATKVQAMNARHGRADVAGSAIALRVLNMPLPCSILTRLLDGRYGQDPDR